ncbi:MAG: T9SS type A sorting domain-containing protein [Bacteroidia bacterium]|nr:T9SS type A sorting domain-containing protein [Bacteroidia bacterium]
MKSRLLFVLALFGFNFLLAQTPLQVKQRCGTEAPPEAWDIWFNQKVEEFKLANPDYKTSSANYVVPVVFHIIHGGQNEGTFPNVSMAQINSQIPILNNDFAGTGLNVGNFANTNFSQALIANCNITFCLAEKDPAGNTLTQKGIHRVNYISNGWADPASFATSNAFNNFINNTVKPATIWDPNRYLNVWISDVNGAVGLLGYATFPGGTGLSGLTSGIGTSTTDGVWCWTQTIGNTGTLFSPYDKGRTLTHEVGHWLGLRHIWGDGNCATDFCNDTPTQQQSNTGCPSYPNITCSNGPNGDMFMNFMDYCNDACLYMFTPDQRTRIQTAMASGQFRTQMTASSATLCGGGPTPVACSDTLSNFGVTDSLNSYRRATASVAETFCPQGPGLAGYITGTNCWGDLEKAEFISASKYSSATNPVVTGVIVLFFQYGNLGTDGSSNVNMNIYSGTNANTQPGALLGSTSANLASIAATTNTTGVPYCGNPNLAFSLPVIMPFKFNFSSPVAVPQSGGFFASVGIPNTPGDTVCVLDKLTGSSNTAWEKWSDNSWNSMKVAWGGSRNFNLAILPIVECGVVGVKENKLGLDKLSLFPNPGEGKVNLISGAANSEALEIKVYDLYGKLVHAIVKDEPTQVLYEIDLSSEKAGVYFISAENHSGKKVLKYILQK